MYISAGVAKLEYAAGLGPVGGNTVGVRVPPPALSDDSWPAALAIGSAPRTSLSESGN
jgi:hypothetical protein